MKCYYENDDFDFEIDGVTYNIDFKATANYEYDPGRLYMRNGDPGYPPEESFEIEDVDSVWIDEFGNQVIPSEEMEFQLWNYLSEHPEWFQED